MKKGKLGPREELILSVLLLVFAGIGWYLLLYHPVIAQTKRLHVEIETLDDSLAAANNYRAQEAAFRVKVKRLEKEIEEWDSRFPHRNTIVAVSKQIIEFAESFGLRLQRVEPSLFDLYALEEAGIQVSGSFVMQMPLKFYFLGRYISAGKMMEKLKELPFNLSVYDVEFVAEQENYPELKIVLSMNLYVHK